MYPHNPTLLPPRPQPTLRLPRPQRQPPALAAGDRDLVVHQNEGEETGARGLEPEGPQLDGLHDKFQLPPERAGEGADHLHGVKPAQVDVVAVVGGNLGELLDRLAERPVVYIPHLGLGALGARREDQAPLAPDLLPQLLGLPLLLLRPLLPALAARLVGVRRI